MVGLIHVGRWTALVTCVIGTLAVSTPGKSGRHISRATSSWRLLTALVEREQRIAKGENPRGSVADDGSTRLTALTSSRERPISSMARPSTEKNKSGS